jgi:hypothetical protein
VGGPIQVRPLSPPPAPLSPAPAASPSRIPTRRGGGGGVSGGDGVGFPPLAWSPPRPPAALPAPTGQPRRLARELQLLPAGEGSAEPGVGGVDEEEDDDEDARADVAAASGAGLTLAQRRLLALTLQPPPPARASPAEPPPRALDSPAPPPACDPVEGGIVWFVDALGDPLPPGAPAFNLDVDVGRSAGGKARLVVLQGAAVSALAAQFLAAHGLPPALGARVAALVQQAARAHQSALLT